MSSETTRVALNRLAGSLGQARASTEQLSGQLERWRDELRRGLEPLRAASATSGGTSRAELRQRQAGSTRTLMAPFIAELQKSLRGMIAKLTQGITGSLTRALGGGSGGGGILSGLLGAGIGLLADRLLKKRQPVQVANEVQARVVNFPSVTDLGFALNPASRLFGGRAVPRGPAFTVELDYRNGAEDVISARVASRLLEENAAQGLWPGAKL
ncbi:hypothetical protein KDL29_07175 [bacterium]|nr:hypothetical protein [bacterium]